MKRLREILRTQFIGAIAVALLAFEALSSLVSLIAGPIQFYILQISAIPYVSQATKPQDLVVSAFENTANLVLYSLASLILYKWLRLRSGPQDSGKQPMQQESDAV